MKQIITSLLDTDLYKFSMGQAIYHQFPEYNTTWDFRCRNKGVKFTHEMVEEIKHQIQLYCNLSFTESELSYLHSIGAKNGKKGWIHQNYVDFLRLWKPRYEDFDISENAECGLAISAKGTWLNTSMYEIPTLAIVNEVYFRMAYDYDKLFDQFKKNTDQKIKGLVDGKYEIGNFSEFGLRRRLSFDAQEYAVKELTGHNKDYNKKSYCVGTSNVYLANKYSVTPVGTCAHEFLQAVGQGDASLNPAYSNKFAMDSWIKEYGVLNGTWLTDVIGDKLCRMDMTLTYSTLFSGVRNDSGDMKKWADDWIAHYNEWGIDPKTKTLLFSNSLDFERATDLYHYVDNRAKCAFGIGTYLSNDCQPIAEPLNIVMKMVKCNGHDVAKLSDDEGKGMCRNPDYVEYLKRCINWRLSSIC